MKKVTQEQVKMIENLAVDRNWGLNWQSKWNILLAKLGLKSASEMHFSERVDGQNREYIEGMISELKKSVRRLKFHIGIRGATGLNLAENPAVIFMFTIL